MCKTTDTSSATTTAVAPSAGTTPATTASTTAPAVVEVFRKDYKELTWLVKNVHMNFDIRDNITKVTCDLFVERNPNVMESDESYNDALELNGEDQFVTLESICINDGPELQKDIDYKIVKERDLLLVLDFSKHKKDSSSSQIKVTTVCSICPETNTSLVGLYNDGNLYSTQCEAHGFRRITYYPDRPDNMAIFEKVRLEANQQKCPILLSNGNLVESGTVDGSEDRHYAIWKDPFPKPSYLFCCVAGDLGSIADTFTTMSGKTVKLQLYSEHENVHKLHYAMQSLKDAMKWDEETFGLEYDLDLYNIVAVNSFNMGAMENKGLNVFNTAFVLADQASATDADFQDVQRVIGHEYFHNWTGNRVTCRDWFQLTLKEGLTVFRDQEFSGDMMNSKSVTRIEKVKVLRARQFSEDAGPMSHPIRPESYISMDNFYTSTVYNKGAEVIRMYQTILTKEGFRKGMDLYFKRHDGQAATCDDFLAAMQDANNVDLKSQFALWYSTNGTPTVTYDYTYSDGVFKLTLSQSSNSDLPLYIPVSVGLLDQQSGKEVVPTTVLALKEMEQSFEFPNLEGPVVPSILRNFSAPVKLVPKSGEEDEAAFAFLAANDTDGFNRWEAVQKLYTQLIFQIMSNNDSTPSEQTLAYVKEAFGRTLQDSKATTDYSIMAYALLVPTESTLAELVDVVDPIAIYKARKAARQILATTFVSQLQERYDELTTEMTQGDDAATFKVDAISTGKRRLRNVLLGYLCCLQDTPEQQEKAAKLAMTQFKAATGMADKITALSALTCMSNDIAAPLREEALEQFYKDANGDALIINKWFSVQAQADCDGGLERVKKLQAHPDFSWNNPNRVRSLLGGFCMANTPGFHHESGSGYEYIRTCVQDIDPINPQLACRLAKLLTTWKKYDDSRALQMKGQLEVLLTGSATDDDKKDRSANGSSEKKLMSKDLQEIVMKGLA